MAPRRWAIGTLVLAALAIAAVQWAAPVGAPPLYDGVVVLDTYRYLAPAPGQAGSPTSYSGSQPVVNGTSPAIAAATAENPPQAQLIAGPAALVVAPGTTALTISIQPVAPATPLPGDPIAGNAYRFIVSDQAGAATPIGPGLRVTIALRAPDRVADARMARYTGTGWQALPTGAGGQGGIFLANVDALGDFALLATPGPGLDPRLVAGAVLAAGASVLLLWVVVARPTRRSVAPTGPPPSSPKRRTRRRNRWP